MDNVREMYVKLVNGEVTMEEFENWVLDQQMGGIDLLLDQEYHYVH